MLEQLAFPFHLPEKMRLDNFIGAENQAALNHLKQSIEQASNHYEVLLYFWGKPTTGKTHLLIAACHQYYLNGKRALYIDFNEEATLDPTILDNLEEIDLLALDNIEHILNNPLWETKLFQCFNQMQQHIIPMLLSANCPPQQLNVALADLKSRLSWGATYHLQILDNDETIDVLKRVALQRGLNFSDIALQYLINHYQRDLKHLIDLVEQLDVISLQQKRKITIPLIKEMLKTELDEKK